MRIFLLSVDTAGTRSIWLGDAHWSFLAQVLLRSIIMFAVVVICMRILGKRGVMQLSVFELVILLVLGSAAGDPMLYADVGIVPAVAVMLMVVALYRAVIYFLSRNRKFEIVVKGRPEYLIRDGSICISEFRQEPLAFDEFYAELRMQNVSHLGQVKYAVIETSGEISLFCYSNDEVRYGLPIMPRAFDTKFSRIEVGGYYSCVYCGHTDEFAPTELFTCIACKRHYCLKAVNHIRIS